MLQLNCGLPSLTGKRRLPQIADHPLQHALGLVLPGMGEEHRELVRTQPAHPVTIAHRRHQVIGEAAQHLVAGGMAEAVIDQLEMVQVDVAQRVRTTFAAHLQQRAFEQAFDLAPVDQAGQRVMAGVVLDLARQCMVLADVFDDREHRQGAAGAAHTGAAPAAPDQAAITTAEAQLARAQLAVPIDAPHPVNDQLAVHQQVSQRQLQQHVAAMIEDVGHRLVGLDHLAFGIELEHADVGLVERCAEAALVFGQVLADAARQGHRHQADRQHRQARDHQRRQPHQRRHPQQRLRERLALHLHPAVEITQLLQVLVSCGCQ